VNIPVIDRKNCAFDTLIGFGNAQISTVNFQGGIRMYAIISGGQKNISAVDRQAVI
jgi:hypothetical protein